MKTHISRESPILRQAAVDLATECSQLDFGSEVSVNVILREVGRDAVSDFPQARVNVLAQGDDLSRHVRRRNNVFGYGQTVLTFADEQVAILVMIISESGDVVYYIQSALVTYVQRHGVHFDKNMATLGLENRCLLDCEVVNPIELRQNTSSSNTFEEGVKRH